jgi:hypothetical protein
MMEQLVAGVYDVSTPQGDSFCESGCAEMFQLALSGG